jgi:large subunit ribosomal protein L29
MATAADIAQYDTEELERQLGDTRRELFNLRFQLATGQLDNFSRINHVRKDVARMMTELRNREIAEAEGIAFDDLPAHQAAARRRTADEALGRSETTASERRAAAKAKARAETEESDEDADTDVDDELVEGAQTNDDLDQGDLGEREPDEDELAEEVADDDGMALPDDESVDGIEDSGDPEEKS